MASLTGQTIQSTYDGLLKTSDSDAITSSLKRITDGLGNFTPLYLSSTAVEVSSALTATSFVRTGGTSSQFLKADGSVDSSTYTPTSRTLTINGETYDLSANRSWTIAAGVTSFNTRTGAITLTSGDVTGALGYTPYNATNPAGYISGITRTQVINALATGGSPFEFLKSDGSVDTNSYVTFGRTLTINGVTFDLSADRSWTISGGISSLNGLTGATQTFATGTSGSDFNISSAGTTHTFNIPTASSSTRGLLSSADWVIFANRISGSGTTNYIPKFNGATSLANSLIFDNGTNVGIGTSSPLSLIHVAGNGVDGQPFFDQLGTGQGANIILRSGRGSVSSPSAAQAGDLLGSIGVRGYGTTGFSGGGRAGLYMYAAETFTDSAQGSFLLFGTTTIGTASRVERMRITDAGNVGIGTSSPASILNVSGGNITVSAGFGLAWSGDQTRIITPEDNVSGALIQTPGIIRFNAGSSEKMRITSVGNVGIGTSSPTNFSGYTTLTIDNTAGSFTEYRQAGSNTFRVGSNETNGGFLYTQGSTPIRFGTVDTERMRITSGGNVGIGTSSPTDGKLQVAGNTQLGNTIAQTYFGVGAAATRVTANGSWAIGVDAADGNTERMRITSGGNVGIGTSSPAEILDVRNAYREPTSGEFTQLLSSTTTQDAGRGGSLGFGGFTNGTSGFTSLSGIKGSKENGDGGNTAGNMIFYTRPNGGAMTERMRITSGGNVGIGTSSPGYRLDVVGTIYASGDVLAFSDISVKENIRPIDNALERVLNSRGVVYDRIDNEEKDNIGFIAQELEVNFPELVSTKEDGTKSVKYQNAVAVMFEAIKELTNRVVELESRLN